MRDVDTVFSTMRKKFAKVVPISQLLIFLKAIINSIVKKDMKKIKP